MELIVLRFSQEVSLSNPKDSSNNYLVIGVKGTKKEIRIPVSEAIVKEIVTIAYGQDSEEAEVEEKPDELADVEEQADVFEEPDEKSNQLGSLDEDGIESL